MILSRISFTERDALIVVGTFFIAVPFFVLVFCSKVPHTDVVFAQGGMPMWRRTQISAEEVRARALSQAGQDEDRT